LSEWKGGTCSLVQAVSVSMMDGGRVRFVLPIGKPLGPVWRKGPMSFSDCVDYMAYSTVPAILLNVLGTYQGDLFVGMFFIRSIFRSPLWFLKNTIICKHNKFWNVHYHMQYTTTCSTLSHAVHYHMQYTISICYIM